MIHLIERVVAGTAPDADTIGGAININETGTSVGDLVTQVVSWIVYIAAILAFIYLVVSGITFITAGGNAEQAKKGQTGLIYAIVGIVVVVLAFVILQAAAGIGNNATPGA